MERPSFVKHGVLRLPPGFRFHPTDEELVVQYLKRKVLCCPLPAAVIPEINLSKYDPWDLPGEGDGERYFFSLREATYPNGSRSNGATLSGYWKATGKDRPVVASGSNEVVGMKKVLVFHRGKPPRGSRTEWIMHEYRCLAACETRGFSFAQRKNFVHSCMRQTKEDWVVCRIFEKRAKMLEAGNNTSRSYNDGRVRIGHVEFLDVQRSSSSSSSSSCVTDLSSEEGEEGSSNGVNASPPCGSLP
ncbi:hypothetical protein OPV22_033978 [Ensete ventricosum]|uniref:NAC domain-containing protein n=1 Tax=Ensete ventricosum TaxID=4639 RepID=A0AAV8Q0Y8_ENSVE|nr:hypothetical protein OPV22_033978 [Ensete ventricosum]